MSGTNSAPPTDLAVPRARPFHETAVMCTTASMPTTFKGDQLNLRYGKKFHSELVIPISHFRASTCGLLKDQQWLARAREGPIDPTQ